MIRLLLAVLSVCLFLPFASVHAQDAAEPDASNAMSQLVQQANENGMTVIILDGNGSPVMSDASTEAVEEINVKTTMTSVMRLQWELEGFNKVLQDRIQHLPVAINEVLFILRASSPDGSIFFFAKQLLITLVLLAFGLLFERQVYGRRLAARFVIPLVKEAPEGYTQKLPFLVVRFIAGVIGVFVGMTFAALLGLLIFGTSDDTAVRFTNASIFAAYAISRLIALVWRMILSPFLPQYRIPPFSTPDAKKLHLWVMGLGIVDVVTMIFGEWLSELGLVYDVSAVMTLLLSTLFALGNIALVFANYRAISYALRNGREPNRVPLATRWASTFWAPLFILYVLYGWASMSWDLILGNDTGIPLIAGAYGILTAVIVVYATINYGIERYFERNRTVKEVNDAADALREEAVEEGQLSEQQEEELFKLENLITIARCTPLKSWHAGFQVCWLWSQGFTPLSISLMRMASSTKTCWAGASLI
jgi:hypothetical protein